MPPQTPSYLSDRDIVDLHDRIIDLVGGMPGLRDAAALDSCVAQPKTAVFGHERFASIYDKAAAYCFYIVRGHPFFDGNKRSGFLAALHFLRINGVSPTIDEDAMFDMIIGVAVGDVTIERLAQAFGGESGPPLQ